MSHSPKASVCAVCGVTLKASNRRMHNVREPRSNRWGMNRRTTHVVDLGDRAYRLTKTSSTRACRRSVSTTSLQRWSHSEADRLSSVLTAEEFGSRGDLIIHGPGMLCAKPCIKKDEPRQNLGGITRTCKGTWCGGHLFSMKPGSLVRTAQIKGPPRRLVRQDVPCLSYLSEGWGRYPFTGHGTLPS